MHFPPGQALDAPKDDLFQRTGFLKAAEGSDAEFSHPLRVSWLPPMTRCLSGVRMEGAARDHPPYGRAESDRDRQAPGQPRLSLNERGWRKKIKTLRYMNCEIKSKYSNKESHNNISKDVYQGLKLNTDFFINPNTKCNKDLWNVKYNLQGKKCALLP